MDTMTLDRNGLYDIYDIWHVPFWQTTWFKIMCGSLLAVIVLGIGIILGYYVYKWLTRKKYTVWEIAQIKLEELKKSSFTNKEQAKNAYGVITTVLKEYLAERYSWPVKTTTDDELAAYVKTSVLNEELTQKIKEVLSGAVMIKFANQDTVESQVKGDIERALQIIHATIPLPKK